MIVIQKIKIGSIRRLLKLLCLGMGLMTLSACAVHKASFDCPNGKGMGCGSMIDVHNAIKDKSFAREVETRNKTKPTTTCKSCQKANLSDASAAAAPANKSQTVAEASLVKNSVFRSQDKIMRIWFNSYFDEYNNFHDSQYIYTVIQPAQWVVNK